MTGFEGDVNAWLTYVELVGYIGYDEFDNIPVALFNMIMAQKYVTNLQSLKEQLKDTKDTKSRSKISGQINKIEIVLKQYGSTG